MKVNMGLTDRRARAGVGVVLVVLSLIVGLGSVGGVILGVLGVIMLATAATGFCPLYVPLKLNTLRRR
jgi:hypothetical protein